MTSRARAVHAPGLHGVAQLLVDAEHVLQVLHHADIVLVLPPSTGAPRMNMSSTGMSTSLAHTPALVVEGFDEVAAAQQRGHEVRGRGLVAGAAYAGQRVPQAADDAVVLEDGVEAGYGAARVTGPRRHGRGRGRVSREGPADGSAMGWPCGQVYHGRRVATWQLSHPTAPPWPAARFGTWKRLTLLLCTPWVGRPPVLHKPAFVRLVPTTCSRPGAARRCAAQRVSISAEASRFVQKHTCAWSTAHGRTATGCTIEGRLAAHAPSTAALVHRLGSPRRRCGALALRHSQEEKAASANSLQK